MLSLPSLSSVTINRRTLSSISLNPTTDSSPSISEVSSTLSRRREESSKFSPQSERMANDTGSSHKSKDEESNSSRKKAVISKGSSSSGSATTDASGLRRSTRETPSRKQISSSPSTTWKSERLEKRTPRTTPVKRKFEIVEKPKMPSPLRSSDRGKKHASSSSSGSKYSDKGFGSSDVKRKKLKRERSMKQLTLEAMGISRREKQDPKPVGVKKKRMDARTYKSLFKKQRKRDTPDINEDLERPDKLSQVDSNCCGGSVSKQVEDEKDGVEKCSERMGEELREMCTEGACEGGMERLNSMLRKFDAEAFGNNDEVEIPCSSQKHSSREEPDKPSEDGLNASKSGQRVKETLDDAEMVQVDYSAVEKLQTPEFLGSVCMGTLPGERVASKRERYVVEMDSKGSAAFASKHICITNVDAVSPPSSGCKRDNFVRTCLRCSKRRRVDYDSPVQELCLCDIKLNKDLHDASIPKDRGKLEASVQGLVEKNDGTAQRKESPLDVQIDGHQTICVICKLGGELLCCDGKGCKRRYHLSCLDPLFDDVPLGVWHCFSCVKKKIESGVYSVSEGVESICDAREVEVQDAEGTRKQKQYFVKYKGLAHIYNHWVPETQLLLEAPLLVSKLNQNNQVMKWREQWRVPHCLLKKRLLRSPKQQDDYHNEHAGDISDCHYEWLVKWCGLGYEYVTWELENASFLHSPQAQSLIRKYENRRQRAKRAASFSLVDKNKKGSLVKLSKLPAGVVPGIDNNQLSSVNKLREYWHKGQNAVVIDDQERVTKVILFIHSLGCDVGQPFLIFSNTNALALWEAEFSRLAPSIDVVVYSGNRDSRKIIRTFEFYEEGGCIMFQVLLFPIEALVKDFEILECHRWEAIIVDECQRTGISKHFEQIKMLTTEVRVLLFNGQLKDSIAEHRNMLSLLDSLSDLDSHNCLKTDLNDNLGKLRERLSRFIAYDCKSESSRFLEYWVPVLISNVQLEQYCASLLSNSMSLRSGSKNDPVGALRHILIATRKCCDHPYIVDPSLQGLLTNGLPELEYLDVGINASGKLQFLDTILSEIKNRGLRVVILFQSIGGSGRDSIGDILDDFLRQRFGPDSYERIDRGVLPSKKQAALNKFNDKGSGRFVFLIENRACLPSIKLSSVDTIVIFDSDWNPTNDLKALQKISIDSPSEQIKIFRLYSSCTVEEKVLVLATHDVTLDSNLQNISQSAIHMLLTWGASYLFCKLDEFHDGNISTAGANISSVPSLLKDVAQEFLALLCQGGANTYTNNSLILKVQHGGGTYSRNASLIGELIIQLTDGEEPHVFWTKLLEGRNPQWKYSFGPSQRNRKRVQYVEDLPKKPEVKADEVGKKSKKVVNDSADRASLRPRLKEGELPGDRGGGSRVPPGSGSQLLPKSSDCVTHALYTNHASTGPFSSNGNSLLPELHMVAPKGGIGLRDMQKSLHVLLKPEISKLCEILQLSEDVKVMVGRFLEYVIDNHHVNREPATMLQAFQMSLCWIAASLLKYKIDKKESLSLAKQHLNFSCAEEEANNIYSKLWMLKKMFCVENFKESESSKDSVSAAGHIMKELPDARMSQPLAFSEQNVNVVIEERSEKQEFAEDWLLLQQEQAPKPKIEEKEISKCIKRIQKKCEKRKTKLIRKQLEEIQELDRIWEGERVQLEKQHRLESALVRSIHRNIPVRLDKLKRLDDEFAKKMEQYKRQKEISVKDLDAKQLAERNEEKQNAARRLEEVNSWTQAELSVVNAARAGVLRQSLALQDECSESSTSTGNLNVLQQVEVPPLHPTGAGPSDQTNHKAVVIEHAEQLRLSPSTDSPVDQKEPDSGSAYGVERQPCGEGHITSLNTEAPQQCEDPAEPPNQAILQHGKNVAPPPTIHAIDAPASGNQNVQQEVEVPPLHPTDAGPGDQINHEAVVIEHAEQLQLSPSTDSPVDQNESNSGSASGAEEQPCSEGHITSLNTEASQQCEDPAEPPNQAILQPGENLAPPPTIHAIDAPASGNQNVQQEVEVPPLHPTDAGPTDQTGHEAVGIKHAEQLQLSPSTDAPVDQNEPNSGSASGFEQQPHSEGHIISLNMEAPQQCEDPAEPSLNGEAPQQFEDPAGPSNQAVLQPGENLAPPPQIHAMDAPASGNQNVLQPIKVPPLHPTDAGPTDQTNQEAVVIEHVEQLRLSPSTDSPVDQNQPNSGSASGVEQPRSEGHITSLNVEAPQQFEDPAESSNQAVLQPGANLAPPRQIHAVDAPARGNQNVLQQVEVPPLNPTDTGPTDQTDHEAVVIEHAERLQLSPSTDSPVDQNQPNSVLASGVEQLPCSEGHINSFYAEAPQQFEDPAEPSNRAVLQPGANLAPPPQIHAIDAPAIGNHIVLQQVGVPPLHLTDSGPTDQTNHEAVMIEFAKQLRLSPSTDSPVDQIQPNPGSASGVEQPHSEGHITSLNAEAPQQFEDPAEPSNQAVLQPGANLARGSQNFLQQVEVPPLNPTDAGPTDQTDHEAVLIEHAQQLQLSPSTDSPLDQNQPYSVSASGVGGNITSLNAEAPQQFEDQAEPSNQAVLQPGANLAPPPQIHAIGAPAIGNHNFLQQVEVPPLHTTYAWPTDQTNHAAVVIQHVEQLWLSPSTDSPIDQNQPNSGSASGFEPPHSEGHITSLNAEAPQQFDDPAEPSNQAVLQPGPNLAPPPPIHGIDVPVVQNQPYLHIAVRNDQQPSSEGCTSFQNVEALSQLVEDIAGHPNHVPGTQLGMHRPIDTGGECGTYLPLHSAHQEAFRMPTQPLYADPLQNELERLRKELEEAIKVYDDTKLRLKSACEKEIEEIIAEIRRKYVAELQGAEAAFLLKKKELDTNHKKVFMNKILADAFRSKSLDLRPSGALGMQQVVPSNFMQQLHLPASQAATRPSHVTGSSSAVPAAASQQTTPPAQFVCHSSVLFSSMPTRPPQGPHIVPITPPTGNRQVFSEIRAPAPHLQPFRPSSSMTLTSIASLSQGLPSQQAPRNVPTASPPVPLVPPRPPSPPPPTYHSGHYDRAPQPEVTGGLPSLQNSCLSALRLLVDINNQPGAHPPNILPPLPDLGLTFGSLDLSQFGAPGSGGGSRRVNLDPSGVVSDLVCLSDDD